MNGNENCNRSIEWNTIQQKKEWNTTTQYCIGEHCIKNTKKESEMQKIIHYMSPIIWNVQKVEIYRFVE